MNRPPDWSTLYILLNYLQFVQCSLRHLPRSHHDIICRTASLVSRNPSSANMPRLEQNIFAGIVQNYFDGSLKSAFWSGWPDLNRRPPEPHIASIKGGGRLPPFWCELYPLPESKSSFGIHRTISLFDEKFIADLAYQGVSLQDTIYSAV